MPLVDLDQLDPMEIRAPKGRRIKKIKVPSLLKEIDFLISVPVMKTHMHTRVSLSLAISEMASVLFPHVAIIDGTVGMEGMGPAYGNSKKAALIVVGDNAVSTDAVAARLMGLVPETVPHLRLCAKRGLGEVHHQKIVVEPEDYVKWMVLSRRLRRSPP